MKIIAEDAPLTGYWHGSRVDEPEVTAHGHYIEGMKSDGTLYSYAVTHDHRFGYQAHDHPKGVLCELTPSAIMEMLHE